MQCKQSANILFIVSYLCVDDRWPNRDVFSMPLLPITFPVRKFHRFTLLCFCSFDFLCCCNINWNNSWCSVWHADCFCSWPLFTVYRCATLSTEILLWQMVKWVRWTARIDFMSIPEISINYTLVKMNIIAWLQRQSQSIAHRRNSGMSEKSAQQMIMSIVAGQNGKNIVAIVMPNGNGHSMFAFFPQVFCCSADSVFARHCNCHGKAI